MPELSDLNTDLKYYIDLLMKRRLLIAVVAAVTFLMIMVDYILTPPTYTAKAGLLIEPEHYANLNTNNGQQQPQSLNFETQSVVIKSEPVFTLAAASLGEKQGSPGFTRMVSLLDRSMSIDRIGDSNILVVSVKSNNARFSADAANAIVNGYIQFLNEQNKRRIGDITLWLQGELDALKNKVEASQTALIKYIEEQEAKGNSDAVMFFGDPADNAGTKALADLETKYITLQMELTNMLQQYKEKYPAVIQLRNDIKALNARITMMKQAMLEANKKRIRYMMLSRDTELTSDMYNMLTKELKEIDIFGEISYPTATILQHASVPAQRSGRGLAFWLLFGLFMSAVTGVGSAFLADQIDSSIKSDSDVEKFIKHPLIGTLPYLEEMKGKEPGRFFDILNSPSSQIFMERLRLLRINLKYSFIAKSGKVLLISSTAENEGKSTLSASLAYILSMTGAKVLLMDADVKKPDIHKFFNAEQTPGYTELLIDTEPDAAGVLVVVEEEEEPAKCS